MRDFRNGGKVRYFKNGGTRRFFKNYQDDTLRPLDAHDSGYLVGRKPVVFSFLAQPPKRHNGRKAAGTLMGKRFAEKLKKEGI